MMQKHRLLCRLFLNRRRNYTCVLFMAVGAGFLAYSMCCNTYTTHLSVNQSAPTNGTSSLRDILRCYDVRNKYKLGQKGNFWVHYNYIPADMWFPCNDSITYATTTDVRYIEHLEPIVQRWKGPVSVAFYAPGSDFQLTLQSIQFMRRCRDSLIRQYVSFHLFFDSKHTPKFIPKPRDAGEDGNIDCTVPPPWINLNASNLYRIQKKLLFPINVGRNIARDATTTHFMLVADVELYPSTHIIPDFLQMIRTRNHSTERTPPEVFVLPPFDVVPGVDVPETKKQLVKMINIKKAFSFQTFFCDACHRIPKRKQWMRAKITSGLQVLHTSKRPGHWEPFYIGTNDDPYFDERFTWEGGDNKMIQAYTMCLLDYDYHILNNAFLVHRPDHIKRGRYKPHNRSAYRKSKQLLRKQAIPEIHTLFRNSVIKNKCQHVH